MQLLKGVIIIIIIIAAKINNKTPYKLKRKYHINNSSRLDEVTEDVKQRLVAISHRLKRYENRNEQYRINSLFKTNPKKIYRQFRHNKTEESESGASVPVPNTEAIEQYWRNIWSKPAQHNQEADWLSMIETKSESIPRQPEITVTENDIRHKLTTTANWKAPGPDLIQAFWMKKFTNVHQRMARHMNDIIRDPSTIPNWLVEGRTHLILKDAKKGSEPENFRPITCLPTMWKLFSGIIARKIMHHITINEILHREQKGACPGSRGAKEQLATDRTITKDNKKRNTNLAMAWIDYKKAFDSVPHSWIVKCMEMYKINTKLQEVIISSMTEWKTTLMHDKQEIGKVPIKRGIFQGDSLSPLLFCLAINPLSDVLHGCDSPYKTATGQMISHLLYMDDLKLYSRKEEGINSLIQAVHKFSDDIQMKFGLNKCARLIIHRGKVKNSPDLPIEEGVIPDISRGSYKYLGILQQQTNKDNEAKTAAMQEYKKRLKKILKSKLHAKNKIEAINTFAIPVITYTAGIVKWTVNELNNANRSTRKIMNIYGGLHPRADIDRLYIPREKGGRGLHDIKEAIESEERSLIEHLWTTKEDHLTAAAKRGGLYNAKTEAHEAWKKNKAEERLQSWKNKPLHGQYPRQVEAITSTEHCYKWLKKVNLKIETEALLTAAQDQALNTKAHKAHILKLGTDPKCRMCGGTDETITHILSSCPTLAPTAYTARHNEVAKVVHRNICKAYQIPTPDRYWKHEPPAVTENGKAKILWDFDIHTDRRMSARRPDIVAIDKEKRTTLIIDIAVPEDRNINTKEREKIDKYQDLRLEIMKMWNTSATVIPIVIGALGAHTAKLQSYLDKIPGDHHLPELVKAALLGSAYILRRTLDLPESW